MAAIFTDMSNATYGVNASYQSMNPSQKVEFNDCARKVMIDGVVMGMDEMYRYVKNPPESYVAMMARERQRLHKVTENTIAAESEKEDSKYDYLYITDELISGRIQWEGVSRIEIKYYEASEVGVPWWKFWVDRCTLANEKNKLLWQEARAVFRAKKMSWQMSPLPPLRYRMM